MHSMDLFDGFHLCEIVDCKLNKGEVCSINANFDDVECRKCRVLPENKIKKDYFQFFNKKDCIQLDIISSSKGAQRKWLSKDEQFLIKEQFYYQLRYWNDDLVEVIASGIGKQLGINCVEQWLGNISGSDCSFSHYWGDKRFISFGRFSGYEKILEYTDVVDRIKFAIDLAFKITQLDLTQYLANMTIMDFLIGNEDRHFFNFGILHDGKNYEIAPLFDFGLGLFEHDVFYKDLSLEQCISKMSKKPFHSWDKALDYFASAINLPKITDVKISRRLLPNSLSEPYLRYSFGKLGIEVCLCD